MNLPTIITVWILALCLAAIAVNAVHKKRSGRGSCSCGTDCGGCGGCRR